MIEQITLNDSKLGTVTYKWIPYMDKFKNMLPWLEINKEEWTYINNNWDVDTVKESLTVLLSGYEFPFKDYKLNEIEDDFLKLCQFDISSMVTNGEWFSKSTFNYPIENTIIGTPNTGNKASDYFQQENRYDTELENSPSQIRVWNTPSMVRTLINAFYTMKYTEINKSIVRGALSLRKGVASQFKPSVAKWVYDTYKAKTVLDTSMGWGDRLCGFFASNAEHYVGIDPNDVLHKGYSKQADYYNMLLENNKKYNFYPECSEDIDLSKYNNYFDLMFTSPPYFNREKYTKSDKQSWVRWNNIEDWVEHFLLKMINNITPTIKSGGRLIINISDVCSTSKGRKKGWLSITQPMLDYMANHKDWELDRIICYKMTKKPNLKSVGTGIMLNGETFERFNEDMVYGEPVFIWKKL